MTRTIPTKEAAQLLRQGLQNEFPGVKFNVRMGRGTGSAWLHITYTDGPTEAAVRDFDFRYQGTQFNSMTDMYDLLDDQLIAFDDRKELEKVRFLVDGILEQRSYSPQAWLYAQSLLDDAGYAHVRVCSADGQPIEIGPVPEWVAVDDRIYPDLYSPAGLARSILLRQDLTQVFRG